LFWGQFCQSHLFALLISLLSGCRRLPQGVSFWSLLEELRRRQQLLLWEEEALHWEWHLRRKPHLYRDLLTERGLFPL
jgi:hypothetical protein